MWTFPKVPSLENQYSLSTVSIKKRSILPSLDTDNYLDTDGYIPLMA